MKSSLLTSKQIEIVKAAVGEMLLKKSNEANLKSLLDNAGASTEDLHAIMNYFEEVQNELDTEVHAGAW